MAAKMVQKPSKMANLFSFRTSYFNTNIRTVTGSNTPSLFGSEDSVDNNGKKRRPANNQNQNQTQTQQDEKTTTTTANSNIVVEVDMEEDNQDQQEIENADAISDILGHFGWWQFIWCVTLSLFQFPSTFHLFSFVFEVSDVGVGVGVELQLGPQSPCRCSQGQTAGRDFVHLFLLHNLQSLITVGQV